MFQPLNTLFKQSAAVKVWDESDLKYLAQAYIREELKTDNIYCAGTVSGVISIRVKSPTLKQAVQLLEYDIQQHMAQHAKYTFKKLDVRLD